MNPLDVPLFGQMGVYLRGGQSHMPQQFLHRAQVSPLVEQMSGKSMPLKVWRADPGVDGQGINAFINDIPYPPN